MKACSRLHKKEWECEFTWLELVRNENSQVVGLTCELCKRHKRKNKFNQSTVWSETPCSNVRNDAVRHHSLSQQQKGAVEMDACDEAAVGHEGIEQALQTFFIAKVLFWRSTTNYTPRLY